MNVRTFISNNLVLLVMVPVIVGGHYGWYKMQQMEELVGPKEKQLPLSAAFGKIFNFGDSSSQAGKSK